MPQHVLARRTKRCHGARWINIPLIFQSLRSVHSAHSPEYRVLGRRSSFLVVSTLPRHCIRLLVEEHVLGSRNATEQRQNIFPLDHGSKSAHLIFIRRRFSSSDTHQMRAGVHLGRSVPRESRSSAKAAEPHRACVRVCVRTRVCVCTLCLISAIIIYLTAYILLIINH